MKRIIIILAVLTLALSACSKPGTQVGCTAAERKADEKRKPSEKKCFDIGTTVIPTTKPPTTRPPTKPAPRTTAPVATKPPAAKGTTWVIEIKSSAEGYNPRERRVRVGDTIIFKNLDPNSDHSWTENKGTWDSGILKNGKSWTYIVSAKPGVYHVFDRVVPYVLGGPIEVLPAAK